jgi:CRISPR-associated endonuclease Csn1
LARELKKPRSERLDAAKDNGKRRKEREEIAARILKECGRSNPSRDDIEKARLFDECGGICPYTGRGIPFSSLFDNSEFDVEHIIPRSRYPDNSFQNKTLCYLPENREYKRNLTPWEAYGNDPQRWAEIIERVSRWKNKGKLTRFTIQSEKELGDFSARQMNDTRYTSVLAGRLLESLYGGRDVVESDGKARQVIFASSGAVTATLRRSWGFEQILQALVPPEAGETRGKPRTDHRHHAIDAIVIALTRNSVIQAMAQASSLEPWQPGTRSWRRVPEPWRSPDFFCSVQSQIEQVVVSHRPEHKLSGELHDETNYSRPYQENKKTVVHVRKYVSSFSSKDLPNIVDSAIRRAVEKKADELGSNLSICEINNDWPVLSTRDGGSIPIKKVRLKKVLNVKPIGNDIKRRYVAESCNHHIALYSQMDAHGKEKRWEGIIISLMEAYRRSSAAKRTETYKKYHRVTSLVDRTPSGVENSQFKFSLMGGDTVELHRACNHIASVCIPDIYRIRTIAANGQVSLVKITDARMKKDIKAAGDWWSPSVDTLRKLDCRKVVVDLLGRVHPAND